MANDLNQCNFIGRLGADPESRYLSSGEAVVNFRIACGWKTKEKDGAEWVSVVAFGKLAEICQQYLVKGSQVFVSCRLKTDTYDKNGETRYATKFVAQTMQMLGGKPNNDQPKREERQQKADTNAFDPDEDFPF